MLPPELIEIAKTLDQTKGILCQVVATNGGAWNMNFKFIPADARFPSFNVLQVSHPELEFMPDLRVVIDTCVNGHEFAKLPDHPLDQEGRPRYPHCLAIGLDKERATHK